MHKNSYKFYNKKCDNVVINAVDSNIYPYCGLFVFIYAIDIY